MSLLLQLTLWTLNHRSGKMREGGRAKCSQSVHRFNPLSNICWPALAWNTDVLHLQLCSTAVSRLARIGFGLTTRCRLELEDPTGDYLCQYLGLHLQKPVGMYRPNRRRMPFFQLKTPGSNNLRKCSSSKIIVEQSVHRPCKVEKGMGPGLALVHSGALIGHRVPILPVLDSSISYKRDRPRILSQ